MRNEIAVSKIGRPIQNNVLIEVTDIFDEFTTKSGVVVFNAAHEDAWGDSAQYKISNFFIRHGTVVRIPDRIVPDSFDFVPEIEIEPGDEVYFNIVAFKDSTPIVMDERKFMLVHYKEMYMSVRNGMIKPLNGYGVFSPVKSTIKFGHFESEKKVTNHWILRIKPHTYPAELNPRYHFDDIWEIGDKVMLKVLDKPFKVEGDFNRTLEEELYCCPMRMIMCSVD